MEKLDIVRMQTRLPIDVRDWLALQASWNATSINAEIVRSVRERMEREAKGGTDEV